MNIDRQVYQGGFDEAVRRIRFCLDQFEKNSFNEKFEWSTKVSGPLTLEEIIGALVSAEQDMKRSLLDDDELRQQWLASGNEEKRQLFLDKMWNNYG